MTTTQDPTTPDEARQYVETVCTSVQHVLDHGTNDAEMRREIRQLLFALGMRRPTGMDHRVARVHALLGLTDEFIKLRNKPSVRRLASAPIVGHGDTLPLWEGDAEAYAVVAAEMPDEGGRAKRWMTLAQLDHTMLRRAHRYAKFTPAAWPPAPVNDVGTVSIVSY